MSNTRPIYKNIADVIIDLRFGDCGKGKIASLLSRLYNYDYVMRFNGGQNAGHTIVRGSKTFVLHMLPTGVLDQKKCIIGRGCVFNVDELLNEIACFEKDNATTIKLYIDKNAHLVTNEHLLEDNKDTTIGTTKKGVGPAYTDKFRRTGTRAETCSKLQKYLVDSYDLLYSSEAINVLCEGAQGFELDPDWSEHYPYVTSSHCHFGGVLLSGIQEIRTVYGVAKVYDTYSGYMEMQPKEDAEIFNQILQVGKEYGTTTGRKRQINWLNVDRLVVATEVNRVSVLFINKLDVLIQVQYFAILQNNLKVKFQSENEFVDYLTKLLFMKCSLLKIIHFGLSEKDSNYLTFYRD